MLAIKRLNKFKSIKNHCKRIKGLADKIGKALNLNDKDLNKLTSAARLHDIGKIGLSKSILNKPSKLSNMEYEIIKFHSEIGSRLIEKCSDKKHLSAIIKHHHERFDGTGYPSELREKEIPLLSRVISVIDSFDAMTEVRPYREAMSIDDALAELKRCRVTQFDPFIVNIFVMIVLQGVLTKS